VVVMMAFVIVTIVVVAFMRVLVMLVLMRRLRCHLFIVRSEVGMRLGDMLEQFGQHAADVFVGGEIENLLTLALGTHDSRRPQQTQMVTDERRRQTQRLGNCAHRRSPFHARQHNAQARWIPKQAEQIGERNDTLVG
jgi:hypothetical protein